MSKRVLEAYFTPVSKKAKHVEVGLGTSTTTITPATSNNKALEGPGFSQDTADNGYSTHSRYPFPISKLPPELGREMASWPASLGIEMKDQPDLDLLCFEPFVPRNSARELFEFLRSQLPFYRVEYKIRRFGTETQIRTPRYTTVFGLDDTSRFDEIGIAVEARTGIKVSDKRYDKYPPRPLPECLDLLRRSAEAATGCGFNFCLVNYYASGADSISYHSDDERFLGPDPAIASFSLGARRDFYMKHKTAGQGQLQLPLASGDMVLMRGSTQSKWLHSIPKRAGKKAEDGGRINITFRRAVTRDGTENYYNYNVGTGPVYRWCRNSREMKLWRG